MLQIRKNVNDIVNGGLRKHFDPRIINNKIDSLLIVVEYQFVMEYLCIHERMPVRVIWNSRSEEFPLASPTTIFFSILRNRISHKCAAKKTRYENIGKGGGAGDHFGGLWGSPSWTHTSSVATPHKHCPTSLEATRPCPLPFTSATLMILVLASGLIANK